jgi:Skp family chaperone for outer membrane proteins
MKNLFTATALSLATLLGAQACFAEESAAFVAQSKAHQHLPQSTGAEQQAQSTHSDTADQRG